MYSVQQWDWKIRNKHAMPRTALHHTREPHHVKPEDLQRLVSLEMPYGKYKGRLMADLPEHYLAWFAREGFPPGEIGRLLELMHEIDHNGLSGLLTPLRKKS